jgi:hypothetical protein
MRAAVLCLLLSSLRLLGQTSSELAQNFAGCYQMVTASQSPGEIHLPRRFRLLDQPLAGSTSIFHIKALSPDAEEWVLSRWKPRNRRHLTISWSRGLGGYHVNLTEKNGSLVGTAKWWCDARCAFKTPKLPVEAHRVDCAAVAAAGQ